MILDQTKRQYKTNKNNYGKFRLRKRDFFTFKYNFMETIPNQHPHRMKNGPPKIYIEFNFIYFYCSFIPKTLSISRKNCWLVAKMAVPPEMKYKQNK